MPDPLLGPSGQPIQPNPFTQPQGVSGSMTINTSQAQKAMEDFQRTLEGIMKGFGGTWDRSTKDRLASEERFYRIVGDKAREREAMLKRYSRDAIAAIDEETNAKIRGYEKEKHSQEEVHRYSTELTRKAEEDKLHISEEAAKKLKQSTSILSRIQDVGGRVGGPIGGFVASISRFIAEPEIAVPAAILGGILEALGARAAFTRTGAQLAGAGLGLGNAGATGLGFATGLFGGWADPLSRALSADQQRNIIGTMAGSRTMIGQAETSGFGAIQRNLGLFANILPDASKEMELFTDAAKSLGMEQKDISHTFFTSLKNSRDLKITQLDALSAQLEMQKALRNITNDGTVAANVLDNVGSFFREIGKSETETRRMTLGVGAAGAALPLSQIAGMFAFTRGTMPTEQALYGPGGMLGKGGTGVFGLMGSFLTKVGGQFRDPMQRIYAADALNRQLGLGIQTQDLPKFFELSSRLMTGGMGQEDYAKKVAELAKQGRKMEMEGMDTLVSIVNPVLQFVNMFTNFWRDLDSRLGDVVEILSTLNPRNWTAAGRAKRDIAANQREMEREMEITRLTSK